MVVKLVSLLMTLEVQMVEDRHHRQRNQLQNRCYSCENTSIQSFEMQQYYERRLKWKATPSVKLW